MCTSFTGAKWRSSERIISDSFRRICEKRKPLGHYHSYSQTLKNFMFRNLTYLRRVNARRVWI